jgi:hypothetical protein
MTIVWIASYPRSGNTWLRLLFENLRGSQRSRPADINELSSFSCARRSWFDETLAVESSDLTADELDRLRAPVYAHMARTARFPLLLKTHDLGPVPETGQWVPAGATRGVIYVVRDPLDVAVSLSHYLGCEIDEAVGCMESDQFTLCGATDRISTHVRQRIGSWSTHVRSWIDCPGLRVRVIRYEDLSSRPSQTLAVAAEFAGLACGREEIARAVHLGGFAELARQEAEHGFIEKHPTAERFFRQGKVGDWRSVLSSGQIERIVDAHRVVMERLGYSPGNAIPGLDERVD